MRRLMLFPALLMLAGAAFCCGQVGAQVLEGLVNIRIMLDSRVFAVMATLNAAGFDLDSDGLAENPSRRLVRERLSRSDPDLLDRLRRFYLERATDSDPVTLQSKYLSLSLVLKGPPSFELALDPEETPPDARSVAGFERLVGEVWERANLESLWAEVRPYYLEEIEAYRPRLRGAILETLRYMRTEARLALDRQVILIPDLLNGYGIFNARNVGNNYFLLIGPSRATPRPIRALRHEYLHFMIDPLVLKYAGLLAGPEPFLKLIERAPEALPRYRTDFSLVVTESVIRTIERRLDGAMGDEKLVGILKDLDEGLVLAPYFDEAFEGFEKAGEPLYQHFPVLLEGIRFEKEKKRIDSLEALRKEIAERRAISEARSSADGEDGAAVRALLIRANELLQGRRFAEARDLLERALEREPSHAGALFGMGQVAAQEQDFPSALDFYERAASHAGKDTWIAAWSRVRRGNIYRFTGDAALARREWSSVLKLPGDLRGAREAAEKSLSEPDR